MGSLFGAHLARAGQNVILVDVSAEAIAKIAREGLRLSSDKGEEVIPLQATTDPASVGPVDYVLVFVKGTFTESAMRGALALVGPKTSVVTLQNGWGNYHKLASVVGRERVFGGTTTHSAGLAGPGHTKHTAKGMTTLGEYGAAASDRVRALAAIFTAAGIETQVSDDILKVVWTKLTINCCALPPSALLRFTAGELVEHEGSLHLMREVLREVVAVGQAEGVALDFEERWPAIQAILKKAGVSKASMLQDVEARKRTEIDTINGAIVEAGARHGIPTPYNQSLVWLVRALHETF